jgi:hypothetical protein
MSFHPEKKVGEGEQTPNKLVDIYYFSSSKAPRRPIESHGKADLCSLINK